jgi:hypothetical protein
VLGLFFTFIFVNPQSTLNPLPPASAADPYLAYASTSTPAAELPAAFVPTIESTNIPAVIPSHTPALVETDTPDDQAAGGPDLTPPVSNSDDPAFPPIPTHTPLPVIQKLASPAVEPESSVSLSKPEDIFTPVHTTDPALARCSLAGSPDQFQVLGGRPAGTLWLPRLSPPQVASSFADPIPIDRFYFRVLAADEGISDVFTPEIQFWEEDILEWAEEYQLDPNLIATVMQIESCGYTKAKSVAGALGLFQVMPQHFKDKDDPYDPGTNAYRGLRWLQKTLKSGGSTKLALAYYNAGIARIRNPYLGWPNETERYVNWGLAIYQDTRCGFDSSPALQHWLSKGGSALCSRAAAEQLGDH